VTYEELGHLLRMKEADIKKNVLYDALRRGIGTHLFYCFIILSFYHFILIFIQNLLVIIIFLKK
jgi:hypothetical protein